MSTRVTTLLFRLLRFAFGLLFMYLGYRGIVKSEQGAYILLVVGVAFFITGFFKPKRCLRDDSNHY